MTATKKMTIRVRVPLWDAASKIAGLDLSKGLPQQGKILNGNIEINLAEEVVEAGTVSTSKIPKLIIPLADFADIYPEIGAALKGNQPALAFVDGSELVVESTEEDYA